MLMTGTGETKIVTPILITRNVTVERNFRNTVLGSVLEPLSSLSALPNDLICSHGVKSHLHADDSPMFISTQIFLLNSDSYLQL